MYVCMYVRILPKNFQQRYYLFLIYANFFVRKCENNAFERFYKSYLLCAQPNSPASPERRGEAMSSGHRGRGREGTLGRKCYLALSGQQKKCMFWVGIGECVERE